FSQLINCLDKKSPLDNIKGLAYFDKKNNILIDNGPAETIQDLDSLPFPARELTPYKRYSALIMRSPVTSLFTSRGCPFRCKFCDRPALGKIFRARSAENVFQEIKECLKLGIKDFLIYDDTFTVDQQRVIDICKKIIDAKLDIQFNIRARVNTVNPELLHYLKKAGCLTIHYGVESGSEKILKSINKGITLKQVKQAFAWTRKEKIQALAYFMIGHPQETEEDIKKTLKFIRSIDADYVMISIYTPFPRTESYDLGIGQGVFPDVWLELAKNPQMNFQMPIWGECFSKEELQNFMTKGYKAFYLRPKNILRQIAAIRNLHDFMKRFRAGLKIITK
ncbi:MAG: radical SAM protein, partial [Candidatus Portnoybacteria bacterium]|nr:radical SAM protein [Candidatus Portnoybacteria bacterium]